MIPPTGVRRGQGRPEGCWPGAASSRSRYWARAIRRSDSGEVWRDSARRLRRASVSGSSSMAMLYSLASLAVGGVRLFCPGEAVGIAACGDALRDLPLREIDGRDLPASAAGNVGDFAVGTDENFLRGGGHGDGADD